VRVSGGTVPAPSTAGETALDNPVWSCLTTRCAHLALGDSRALRFHPDYSPLSAVRDARPENVAALLAPVEAGEELSITAVEVGEVPEDWEIVGRLSLVQMIRRGGPPLPVSGDPVAALASDDVDDMLALVELTHPGPFRRRTVQLGKFVGIRRDGRLLAMAGERMWIGDHREVSAVCTHPDAQGLGLARSLMAHVINGMLAAGQTPFLHVLSTNERAIATYEGLGFVRRAEIALTRVQRIA
jgi:ribosomal protein S18 acetylase RimI-like enzyme